MGVQIKVMKMFSVARVFFIELDDFYMVVHYYEDYVLTLSVRLPPSMLSCQGGGDSLVKFSATLNTFVQVLVKMIYHNKI